MHPTFGRENFQLDDLFSYFSKKKSSTSIFYDNNTYENDITNDPDYLEQCVNKKYQVVLGDSWFICEKTIMRNDLANFNFNFFNVIDSHNNKQQYQLKLEKNGKQGIHFSECVPVDNH